MGADGGNSRTGAYHWYRRAEIPIIARLTVKRHASNT